MTMPSEPSPADQDQLADARMALHLASLGAVDLEKWARTKLPALLDEVEATRTRVAELEEGRDIQLIEMRGAMRDVRRILADLGVTNVPPRLAAALEGLDQ